MEELRRGRFLPLFGLVVVVLLVATFGCGSKQSRMLRALEREVSRVTKAHGHDNPDIYLDLLRKYCAEETLVGLEEWRVRKVLFRVDMNPMENPIDDPAHRSKTLLFQVAPAMELHMRVVDGYVTEVEFEPEGQ